MPILYETFGPFELTREHGNVTRKSLTDFWSYVESERKDLKHGMGVYLLSTKEENSTYTPWYVGLTESKFHLRFYQHGGNKATSPFAKLSKLSREGNVYVFLLARMTSENRFMKSKIAGKKRKTKVKSITELEFMLIGRCLAINPNLLNISEKSFQEGLCVPGLTDGKNAKRNKSAKEFAAMIQQA